MKAVVIAGGQGSRLCPLTNECPKPMIPLVNKPVLAHILGWLKYYRVTDVVMAVHYLAGPIQSYFGDGRELGMNIRYVWEETPLGTAGAVKNAQPYLEDESFLVVSGDVITDIDLSRLVRFHQEKGGLATLALKQVADPQGYGLVCTAQDGRITKYLEKPQNQTFFSAINTGIYILEPELLDFMRPNGFYDFSYDIFPMLLAGDLPLFGHYTNRYWRDIGTIASYRRAVADVLCGRLDHINLGCWIKPKVWVGHDVKIAPDAFLLGPIYLGNEVIINKGAAIFGPTVIGDRTVVEKNAWIEQSIIEKNSVIGEQAEVLESIIGPECNLPAGSAFLETVIIKEDFAMTTPTRQPSLPSRASQPWTFAPNHGAGQRVLKQAW